MQFILRCRCLVMPSYHMSTSVFTRTANILVCTHNAKPPLPSVCALNLHCIEASYLSQPNLLYASMLSTKAMDGVRSTGASVRAYYLRRFVNEKTRYPHSQVTTIAFYPPTLGKITLCDYKTTSSATYQYPSENVLPECRPLLALQSRYFGASARL